MAAHFILFVSDPARSVAFYREVLGYPPRLDVPGMAEFSLSEECVLGLMPIRGVERLLPGLEIGWGARSEIYLHVPDPEVSVGRAVAAGGTLLSGVELRNWGAQVGYALDPDGHVIAFASETGVGVG